MQRRPRRRLHAVDLAAEGPPPSLPCPDARSVYGSAVSLSACLPRSLCLCAPGRLRFALRCSLAAHARTALRLAVVVVHRSWRLKLIHPPPPPTSPPRLRTPRRLCALVRSQVGIPGPASVARACRAARAASLSDRREGSLVALRSARRTSRACAAGGISRPEISSVQGSRAGN